MTRENKLALLVGFVVILVVGILLSDHFSLARHQKPADLLAVNDPLVESAAASAPLIDLAPKVPARTASNSPPTIGAGHPVEPPDPPGPAGGYAVFLSLFPQAVGHFAFHLRGHGAFANPCGVSLEDPQHTGDRLRIESQSHARAAD